jgi:hypothetical protein
MACGPSDPSELGMIGNFDTARVQRMIEIVTPIFTAQRQPPKEGLTPEDIATNEFIDTSIGVAA